MGVGIRRKDGETWRECAERYGERYGLREEVLEHFDANVRAGDNEADAALHACMEWDVCDLMGEA